MEKIYLSPEDRIFINDLAKRGLKIAESSPQWHIARLALARSLQIDDPPEESLDDITGEGKGSELHLPQVTGQGKEKPEDLTDYFRLLLSEYHGEDLFADNQSFIRNLRRHIRRGLKEFLITFLFFFDHTFLILIFFGFSTNSTIASSPSPKTI